MDRLDMAFRLLPDTVIITDVYWYVLDFNHKAPFERLKKGRSLLNFMPDCREMPVGRYPCEGRVFHRTTTPVYEGGELMGYVVYLADVTEKERLTEARRQKSAELESLTRRQAQANAELEEYIRQVEALKDEEEQLRVARAIHDDAGHAVTVLNTISRMCLQLQDEDPEQYGRLIDDGLSLCRQVSKKKNGRHCDSLAEMLEAFREDSPFPIELILRGEEPPFAAPLYDVILKVCREAYHNTLDHSLADRLTIEVCMSPELLTLRIADNGKFHGTLEKGFGLTAMEENVRASGGRLRFEAEEGRGFGILAEWREPK